MPRAAVCASSLSACAVVLCAGIRSHRRCAERSVDLLIEQEPLEQHVLPDHALQGWWQEWCCL